MHARRSAQCAQRTSCDRALPIESRQSRVSGSQRSSRMPLAVTARHPEMSSSSREPPATVRIRRTTVSSKPASGPTLKTPDSLCGSSAHTLPKNPALPSLYLLFLYLPSLYLQSRCHPKHVSQQSAKLAKHAWGGQSDQLIASTRQKYALIWKRGQAKPPPPHPILSASNPHAGAHEADSAAPARANSAAHARRSAAAGQPQSLAASATPVATSVRRGASRPAPPRHSI
jgi:hypothetical protein